MTLADPYLNMALQNSAVRTLLQARSWLTGSGSSIDRFLFEYVGALFLIKGGCDVVSVAPGDEAAEMRMALSDTWERPHKSLQYWLDHHHGSYAHDLRMAAAAALRAAIRAEQLAAGAPVRGAR
mmetsp:Transcript_3890/g.11095  ORF Transcript_3890/g.11095 Transcript_3890/m.11095 type:complete len:124 (-) Transcript_3890:531-902(-)